MCNFAGEKNYMVVFADIREFLTLFEQAIKKAFSILFLFSNTKLVYKQIASSFFSD